MGQSAVLGGRDISPKAERRNDSFSLCDTNRSKRQAWELLFKPPLDFAADL